MVVKKNLDTLLLLVVGIAFGYGVYQQIVTHGTAHPRPFLIAVSGIALFLLGQVGYQVGRWIGYRRTARRLGRRGGA